MIIYDDNGNPVDDGTGNPYTTPVPLAPPIGTPGVAQNPDPYAPGASPNQLGGYPTAPGNYSYVDPTTGQTIDTGAPQQGWAQNPANGLWQFTDPNAPASAPAPAPSGGTGGSASGGSGGSSSFNPSAPFTVSSSFPKFTAPTVPTIAPFSFAQYQAPAAYQLPSLSDAQNAPGYQFGLQQGLGALKNQLVGKGTFNTGGTPQAIFNYANSAAEQNYSNVVSQGEGAYALNAQTGLNAYQANEGAAKDVYALNADTTLGTYDRQLQAAEAEFNPQYQAANTTFNALYNQWAANLASLTSIASAGAGVA